MATYNGIRALLEPEGDSCAVVRCHNSGTTFRFLLPIAAAIGSPKAARAVGQAVNRNPIWIVIPCHRIIGAGGKLTGYAGGLELKQQLLDLEQLHK